MLQALTRGERTLTELAAPFAISVPAVKKHLRILERAGLISRSRQAQRKPCALRVEPLRDAADWIARHRAEWEARLDRLDAFVMAMQAGEEAARKEASGKRAGAPRSRNVVKANPQTGERK